MFDSLKAVSRRVVGVFLTLVGAVFGQWHPPRWLRAIDHGLANLGRKARAYPRQAGAGILGLMLLAASLYAQLPVSLREGQPLDRLLAHPERWVRLQALKLAGQPSARALLSAAMLSKASQDSDGFIREAAQHLK